MSEDEKNQAGNAPSIDELRVLAEHGDNERAREAAYMQLIERYAEKGDYISLCILEHRSGLPKAAKNAAGAAIERAAMKAVESCAGSLEEHSTLISLIKYQFAPPTAKNAAVARVVELSIRSSRWSTLYSLAENGEVQEVKDHAAMMMAEHLVKTGQYDSLLNCAKSGPESLQKAARFQLSQIAGTLAARYNSLAGDGTLSAGTVRPPAGSQRQRGPKKLPA